MGRPRTFDDGAVLAAAGAAFCRFGYEGTSVDDLVTATGVHRGSLYGAFGSKRGLFVTALRAVVTEQLPAALASRAGACDSGACDSGACDGGACDGGVSDGGGSLGDHGEQLVTGGALDLVLVAALELAPRDAEARDLVARARVLLDAPGVAGAPGGAGAALLGRRLLHRARAGPSPAPGGPSVLPPSTTETTRESAP